MKNIEKALFGIAVFAALMAALYFAISRHSYTISFCYLAAAGLLLITRGKQKEP